MNNTDKRLKLRLDAYLKNKPIPPHDVELVVTFRDGESKKHTIQWETILSLKAFHDVCAIYEIYELCLLEREKLGNQSYEKK